MSGAPSPPKKVIGLALSDFCCNRCMFCGDVRDSVPRLSADEIAVKLAEYRRRGYDGIDISSKEFSLRPDAARILRHAAGLGFKMIHLVTNGHVFADAGKAARLLDCGVTHLTLSLHSDQARTEARITGNRASFERKLAALSNILDYAANVNPDLVFSVNTVMTPLTVRRLDRVMVFVADKAVVRHNLFFPRIQGHMEKAFDETVPRYDELSAPLSRGLDAVVPRGVNCSVLDVPPCVVPRHARMVCSRLSQEDLFNGSGGEAGSEKSNGPASGGKIKGPACLQCPLRPGCEGVFKSYVERRGWAEFRVSRAATVPRGRR